MNDRLGRVCVIRPGGGQHFALIGADQGTETYYIVDSEVGEMLKDALCGCMVCDEQAHAGLSAPGHFACARPTPALLAAERAGAIWRAYTDGGWQWFLR